MSDGCNLKSTELLNLTKGTTKKLVENARTVTHMSVLESLVAACVLHGSTNMLNILKPLLPSPKKEWNESYKSLPIRFTNSKKIYKIVRDKSKEDDFSMPTKVQQYR